MAEKKTKSVEAKASTDNTDKAAADKAAADKAAADKAAADTKVFEYNGRNYEFSKRCPKTLQVDGKVYTKAELINHEDILEQLIVGNSPFVTQA